MSIKIGLNMIVKNEEKVILRCLESVKDIIGFACIVDTGSTDRTKEFIERFCSSNEIQLILTESNFINFSQARNEALNLIKEFTEYDICDNFGLWLDADSVIEYSENFNHIDLYDQLENIDVGYINMHLHNLAYGMNKFFRLNKKSKWIGAVHELLTFEEPVKTGFLKNINAKSYPDGATWGMDQKEKYRWHAKLLQKEFDSQKEKEPRTMFYLAQSYRDCGMVESADHYYQMRVRCEKGFYEERYMAQFSIGNIWYGKNPEKAINHYLKCHELDPFRGEHMLPIMRLYRMNKKYKTAYVFSSYAYNNYHRKEIYPHRVLFIDKSIYDWQIIDEHFVICTWCGLKEECKEVSLILNDLIIDGLVPEVHKERILKNIETFGK